MTGAVCVCVPALRLCVYCIRSVVVLQQSCETQCSSECVTVSAACVCRFQSLLPVRVFPVCILSMGADEALVIQHVMRADTQGGVSGRWSTTLYDRKHHVHTGGRVLQ